MESAETTKSRVREEAVNVTIALGIAAIVLVSVVAKTTECRHYYQEAGGVGPFTTCTSRVVDKLTPNHAVDIQFDRQGTHFRPFPWIEDVDGQRRLGAVSIIDLPALPGFLHPKEWDRLELER